MNKYQTELQQLKPYDEVQSSEIYKGYEFIITAGHGYLVIPIEDINYTKALAICKYGFKGDLACYLEEDSEAPEFLTLLNAF